MTFPQNSPVPSTPMKQTLSDLARGLFAGSIDLQQISITIKGNQLQDEQYTKFRIQQVLNETHVVLEDVWEAVTMYVEKAEVPGVIEWARKS